jgi:hypothetical protein
VPENRAHVSMWIAAVILADKRIWRTNRVWVTVENMEDIFSILGTGAKFDKKKIAKESQQVIPKLGKREYSLSLLMCRRHSVAARGGRRFWGRTWDERWLSLVARIGQNVQTAALARQCDGTIGLWATYACASQCMLITMHEWDRMSWEIAVITKY